MQIRVKLFGPEAQALGRREIAVEATGEAITCAELADLIARAYPRLAEVLPRCRLAVNQQFAVAGDVIRAGDEVALIGQVSGG